MSSFLLTITLEGGVHDGQQILQWYGESYCNSASIILFDRLSDSYSLYAKSNRLSLNSSGRIYEYKTKCSQEKILEFMEKYSAPDVDVENDEYGVELYSGPLDGQRRVMECIEGEHCTKMGINVEKQTELYERTEYESNDGFTIYQHILKK